VPTVWILVDLCEVSSAKRLNALHLKFIDGADLGEVYLRVRPQGGRAVIIIDGSYRFRWSLFWIFDRANCLDLTFSVLSFFREALGRAVNIILIFVA